VVLPVRRPEPARAALRARRLPRSFYARDALSVARDLLGKLLVHRGRGGTVAARIVEVEAYRGPEDRAAHTYGGRRTPRNEVMWEREARLYVYFVYGIHFCANVVAGGVGVPEAVLLRAAEPLAGLAIARDRRGPGARDEHLMRGPACLCKALGLDGAHNGADLLRGPLGLLDAPPVPDAEVGRGPRIGVDYAGDHAARPWRFWVSGSPAVSRPRPAPGAQVS